jgi:CheY-like chemotaxis protein
MTLHVSAAKPARSSPYRILGIDDEAAIRVLLRRQLEQAGYVVVDAPNGRVGIAASGHQPPDIVLTDLFMPEKDGIEVIQEVRSYWSKSRIIAMTGGQLKSSFESVVQPAALLLGADRVLIKPFDQGTLPSAIKNTISMNDARHSRG